MSSTIAKTNVVINVVNFYKKGGVQCHQFSLLAKDGRIVRVRAWTGRRWESKQVLHKQKERERRERNSERERGRERERERESKQKTPNHFMLQHILFKHWSTSDLVYILTRYSQLQMSVDKIDYKCMRLTPELETRHVRLEALYKMVLIQVHDICPIGPEKLKRASRRHPCGTHVVMILFMYQL
ncbi:hypothetical protein Y032_0142g2321 [Ancylostoma ceylanicum]|uniref:Uncharacterized protein n=1 Tax=Ancylostoma ceylanicum TaxID=53326 RepID=A0A016T3T6_9BILA|nr:hypothetical protein Y032_0142g2321 [Ancylostoma ceylanicum]